MNNVQDQQSSTVGSRSIDQFDEKKDDTADDVNASPVLIMSPTQ